MKAALAVVLTAALAVPGVALAAVPPPTTSIVVRPHRVDVMRGGTVVRFVKGLTGPMSLDRLAGIVDDPALLSFQNSTVQQNTLLVLTPGTALTIAAPAVKVWRLGSGGAVTADHAELQLQAVHVEATVRGPYVVVKHGVLGIHDTTLVGLGSHGRLTSGMTAGPGTTALVERSRVIGGQVGIADIAAARLTVHGLRISATREAGLIVREKAGEVDIVDTLVQRGGAAGLSMSGATGRVTLQRVGTTGTRGWGIDLDGLIAPSVRDVRSADDFGGLRARRTSWLLVSGLVAHRSGVGVELGNWVSGSWATRLDVEDATQAAVVVRGQDSVVSDVTVLRAPTGVDVNGRARNVRVEHVSLASVGTGVRLAPGSSAMQLTGVSVDGARVRGLALLGATAQVLGANVKMAPLGLDVQGQGNSVMRSSFTEVATGIVVGARGATTLDDVTVRGVSIGLRVTAGGKARLGSSGITARRAIVGAVMQGKGNRLPPPAFPWLGLAAAVALGMAAGLELLRAGRVADARLERVPMSVLVGKP